MNSIISFLFLTLLWVLKNIMTDESFLIGITAVGILYLLYFIVSEGLIKKIIIGILISVAITLGARFYPPLVILAAVYLIYSIVRSIFSMIQLLPIFFMSVLIFSLLYFNEILFNVSDFSIDDFSIKNMIYIIENTGFIDWYMSLTYGKVLLPVYLFVSFKVSMKIAAPNIRYTLLQLALIIVAIPLVILTILCIRSSIKHFIETKVSFEMTDPGKKVHVAGYTRADGISVAEHTRVVQKPVVQMVQTQVIGAGAAIAGSSKTFVDAINKINKKAYKEKDLIEKDTVNTEI